MKNQLRKFQFTLVEVLIAMGICVVGVVSVMGLFPVGANATRDANMAFYADQAAEQMLNFTRYAVLKDTSASNVVFAALTGWGPGAVDNPGNATFDKPDDIDEPDDWSGVTQFDPENPNPTTAGLFGNLETSIMNMLINSDTEIKCYSLNAYRVALFTKQGGDSYEDFACVVRLWASPILVDETDTSSAKLPRSATFHAEVSWPADLPYERRQKAEYTVDVFVPVGG